jgi:alpha-ribazole phosphatase
MAEALWCWRHARLTGVSGRCIGRSDATLDRRRAKRLAHHIRRHAREHGLARVLWSSPQRRCRLTALCLRRWGFRVHFDARLMEMDFGRWEGRAWSDVAWSEVQAWEQEFLRHAPGGGESLQQLALRAQAFAGEATAPRIVLSHGGWINALRQVPPGCQTVDAASWPAPPKPGTVSRWQRD